MDTKKSAAAAALLLALSAWGMEPAAMETLADGTESTNPRAFGPIQCRGECVGQGNIRDGRECFNPAEVASLALIVPLLARNGTQCTEIEKIIGVQVIDTVTTAGGRCRRVDKYFCETTLLGSHAGYRIDRDAPECFEADAAANLLGLARIIEKNGTHCRRQRDSIVGIKLQKFGACYRAPAVYCNRPY